MNKCIKCGAEIPDGELFCVECSLNPGSSMFESHTPRHPAPPGRMATPQPMEQVPMQSAPAVRNRKKPKGRGGLIAALVLVTLLLAGSLGLWFWQYGDLQAEKNRLRSKEADLALRQTELAELRTQTEDLTAQLEEARISLAAKEQEVETLTAQLNNALNSQNQGDYDLTSTELELEAAMDEKQQLIALCDQLQDQLEDVQLLNTTLEAALEKARGYKEKADFMDRHVVFVEDDGSGYYHSYDCENFPADSFWAYSRKLAESRGFKPCPVCGGRAG